MGDGVLNALRLYKELDQRGGVLVWMDRLLHLRLEEELCEAYICRAY